jgi:hypothetical protein
LFLILTPTVILYSQGYRIDFNLSQGKFKFVQTGGLYIKSLPKTVEVTLNDKKTKRTSLLTGSALIKNLIPENYKVEISKEGYKNWEKSLEIQEQKVTEAKNIILFLEDFHFKSLTEKVENFWLLPSGEKLITLEPSFENPENWSLKLFDLEEEIKSYLISENDIYIEGVEFFGLDFLKEEILLNLAFKEQEKKFSLDLSSIPPSLEEVEEEKTPNYSLSYKEVNDKIYYLDNSGHIYQTDKTFQPRMRITENPFPVKQETPYEIEFFSGHFFLKEKDELYFLKEGSGEFKKVFSNTSGIKASPNEDKVVIFSDREIKVLFLNDIEEQPKRKTGEEILITRLSKEIKNVFWINPDYLIFTSGNTIKVSEIDTRDNINTYEMGVFKEPKLIWNERDKKIYVLSQNHLYVSEKRLIP